MTNNIKRQKKSKGTPFIAQWKESRDEKVKKEQWQGRRYAGN